jgi:peptide/nickel transport system substrate-binding protein
MVRCIRHALAPAAAALAAAALLVPAAGRASAVPDAATVPIIADPGSINPILAADTYGRAVVGLLYPSLTAVGPDGVRRPLLARAWSVSDGGRTVRILLRSGLRWTDGRPVTAADVAATFDAMANRRDRSPWFGVFRPMAQVRAEGAGAVVVDLSRPDPAFLPDALTVPIAPARVVAPLVGDGRALAADRDLNAAPAITAGPFRFVAWQRATDTLVFARNAAYPWGRAHLARLVLQYEATSGSAWDAFLRGQVSVADVPASALVEARALARRGRLRLVTLPTAQFTYIAFNLRAPLWQDPRVRQAAVYAVDRAAINRAVNRPPARLTGGPPPLSLVAPGGALAGMGYDPARAERLLSAAGWRPGPGGVRYRRGQALHFTLLTVAGVPTWDRTVAMAAQDLRAVGFSVDVEYAPFADLVRSLAGPQRSSSPGAWGLAWQMTGASDARTLIGGRAAFPPGGQDVGGYDDPTVTAALQALAAGGGAKARRAEERRLAAALRADPPAIFLFQTVGVMAVAPGLRVPRPGGLTGSALDWPQDWSWTGPATVPAGG